MKEMVIHLFEQACINLAETDIELEFERTRLFKNKKRMETLDDNDMFYRGQLNVLQKLLKGKDTENKADINKVDIKEYNYQKYKKDKLIKELLDLKNNKDNIQLDKEVISLLLKFINDEKVVKIYTEL